MKYHTIEIKNENNENVEVKFRLLTEHCVEIEDKTKKQVMDFVMSSSHYVVTTMLMYLRRSEVPNFSKQDAFKLMDLLIENGYTIETIIYEIIFEALVVSGFLSKAQLEEIKSEVTEVQQEMKKELLNDLTGDLVD